MSSVSVTELEWIILRAEWYALALFESEGREPTPSQIIDAVSTIASQRQLVLSEFEQRVATAGAIAVGAEGRFIAGLVKSGWMEAHEWDPLPRDKRQELRSILSEIIADYQRTHRN